MKKLKTVTALALLASIVTIVPTGCSSTEHATKASSTAAYPTTKCVVSGEDLGDTPYTFVHDGQTVKLCCKDCLAKFNEDPTKYMAKLSPAK